jgi:hypothetical protein
LKKNKREEGQRRASARFFVLWLASDVHMHLFSFSLKLLMATRVRLWPYMVKEYPHHHARPSLGLFSTAGLCSHGSQRNLVLHKFPPPPHLCFPSFSFYILTFFHFFFFVFSFVLSLLHCGVATRLFGGHRRLAA